MAKQSKEEKAVLRAAEEDSTKEMEEAAGMALASYGRRVGYIPTDKEKLNFQAGFKWGAKWFRQISQ